MATPERDEGRKRGSLLGVVAYVLVPGDRRRRAAGHFRRAGFEAAMGLGELLRPGEAPVRRVPPSQRERIELD